MKKALLVLKCLFSAVSIVAVAAVCVMLVYASTAASLRAFGFVDDEKEIVIEQEPTDQMECTMSRIPSVKYIEYTLVDLAEPEEVDEQEEESTYDEEAKLLEEGYVSDEIPLSYDLQMVARDAAERFDVPYALVIAMIWKESSFCETAYNAECYGLMQVASINFHWICVDLEDIGVEDIAFDPEDNIYAGTYMISDLIRRYGDYNLALMAYNCGEAGAAKLWNQGYYSSGYSRSIISYMDDLLERGIAKEMVLDGTFG